MQPLRSCPQLKDTETIWQRFSPREERDKWVRRLVKARLISRRPIWILTDRRSLPITDRTRIARHSVQKFYEYRITFLGEVSLRILNGLVRLKLLREDPVE
jgi:hypothetical protein